MNSYGSAKYNQSDSQPGTNRRVFSLKVLLLASLASLSNAIALNAQQGAPELFSYDELIQLYEPAIPPDALQNKLHLLLTSGAVFPVKYTESRRTFRDGRT